MLAVVGCGIVRHSTDLGGDGFGLHQMKLRMKLLNTIAMARGIMFSLFCPSVCPIVVIAISLECLVGNFENSDRKLCLDLRYSANCDSNSTTTLTKILFSRRHHNDCISSRYR